MSLFESAGGTISYQFLPEAHEGHLMETLRHLFLLNPSVHYLNHGSFGATPRPVFEAYQAWQLRLEEQPVQFFMRDLSDQLLFARQALADYVGTDTDNLVFVPNATHAANVVARSVRFNRGDEILTTDHEYGACLNAWEYTARQAGVAVVRHPLTIPAHEPEQLIDELWAGVSDRTRVIFLSHITSPTALTLPVREICRRARAAGILTAIDGAHAPGQIDLNLRGLDADFYFGNAHKWLCAPKGAAFLYVRPSVQEMVEPLVVGWGWTPSPGNDLGSQFLNRQQNLGTNDLSAYLSVPAAINFLREHDWSARRDECHRLLRNTLHTISDHFSQPHAYTNDSWYVQMAVAPLPPVDDPRALHTSLIRDHLVEAPIVQWNGRTFVRISVQAYNSQEDLDALINALTGEIHGS